MSEVQRPMMTTERFIRIFAGAVVLLSLGLGVQGSPIFVSQNFLWLTAFVGLNLGEASAMSGILLVVVLAVTAYLHRTMRKIR